MIKFITHHIKSTVYTLLVFDVYFFIYGPFGTGFVLVLAAGPPNICFAFAILAFYSGVMNCFFIGFYYGCKIGITLTAGFIKGLGCYFVGQSITFILYYQVKLLIVAEGETILGRIFVFIWCETYFCL